MPLYLPLWWGQRKRRTVRKNICTGLTRAATAGQISCTGRQANEPTKEESPSFLLFEAPFTSVSTVSRGHLSLVSLVTWSHQPSCPSSAIPFSPTRYRGLSTARQMSGCHQGSHTLGNEKLRLGVQL